MHTMWSGVVFCRLAAGAFQRQVSGTPEQCRCECSSPGGSHGPSEINGFPVLPVPIQSVVDHYALDRMRWQQSDDASGSHAHADAGACARLAQRERIVEWDDILGRASQLYHRERQSHELPFRASLQRHRSFLRQHRLRGRPDPEQRVHLYQFEPSRFSFLHSDGAVLFSDRRLGHLYRGADQHRVVLER